MEWNRDLYAALASVSTAGALKVFPSSSAAFFTTEEAAEPLPTSLPELEGILDDGALVWREYFEAPLGKSCFLSLDVFAEPLVRGAVDVSSGLSFCLFSAGGLGVAPSSVDEVEVMEGGEEELLLSVVDGG